MPGRVERFRVLLGERIADLPGPVLEVAAVVQGGAFGVQRHAEPLAERADEGLVLVRSLAQPVVHVQGRDSRVEAQRHVEQADRVAPAREHHQQRLPGHYQPALARCLQRALAQVAFRVARQSWRGSSKPLSFTSPIPSKRRCGELPTASTTESVTSTSPPRARATTREARLIPRPK